MRRTFSHSHMNREWWVVGVALAGMLASAFLAPGAALAAPTQPSQQAQVAKPKPPRIPDAQNRIQQEGAWFQLSHFGDKIPAPDARIKALATAKKLPLSPIGGSFGHHGSTSGAIPHTVSGVTPGVWQPLGPQPIMSGSIPVSGRITALAANPNNANDVWAGAADGGVWNSMSGGQTWTAMTDGQATLSTGAIAIDPTNTDIVYVGTGEANLNGDAYWGAGILKTTDHGQTWTQLGFSDFGGMSVAKLAIDPSNHLNILAAVDFGGFSAPPGGPSNLTANDGVWRSTDGGSTWSQVLHDGSNPNPTGATDVAFDPAHSGVAYAGLGNLFGASGTTAPGVYKSTDSGATWTLLSNGIPTGSDIERVSIGVSHDGTHVYAALTDSGFSGATGTFGQLYNSAIYVSTDSGVTFTAKSVSTYSGFPDDNGEYQWWYDTYAAVDPNSATTAYVGGVDVWKTTDGGTTWANVTNVYTTGTIHPDQHALAFFSPTSSSFYIGNDGGVWSSTNGLATSADLNNGLNITQFYGGSIGEVGSGQQLYGGAQDNGESQFPGSSYHTPQPWSEVFGGDGFYTAVDYTNNLNVYEEYYNLHINKSTNGGASFNPAVSGINSSDPVNFSAPFVESPNHPNTLIAGTDKVYISTNGAGSWTATNGGLPLDGTTQISALAFAPSDTSDQTIYAGDNAGNVFVTTNGGTNWTNITSGFAPGGAMVTGIAVDPTNAQTAWVTYNTFTTIPNVHLFEINNASSNWTEASATLPNVPFESVLVSPLDHNLIIVGTDVGVFDSPDAGATWYQLGSQFPNVAIDQIFMNHTGTKLFVATHGRGMWELPLISSTWYFAEGYTGGSFTTYLTLANPNNAPAHVNVNYLIQGGTPVTKGYTVNANARATINVNNEIGAGLSVSFVVSSDQPIVAERPMYFTYSSSVLSGPVPGGTDVVGATSLGTNFDFGYVDTTANHDTYFTILNQNSAAMTATITYLPAGGGTPIVKIHSIPGNSRGTVRVAPNEGLPSGSYSATVALSEPGLVERPMYLIDSVTGFTGSADVIGVQTPLKSWSFAEGYTGGGTNTFSERYILSNPGGSSASATVTFFKQGGGTATHMVTIAPGAQVVINANTDLGTGVSNSAVVNSTQPILAERFMSFDYQSIPGATDVLGASSQGNQFYFAEGYTGGAFTEYLTIENPNSTAVTATVTFLPANGSAPTTQTYGIGANARFTLNTSTVMPAQSFSMVVSATKPIVAERPMYFNYSSDTGGSDVIGYQP